MQHLYTTEGAASFLGVSKTRVRYLIRVGRLAAERHGRDYIIQESDLAAFAAHGRKPVGRPKGPESKPAQPCTQTAIGSGTLYDGDALEVLPTLPDAQFQLVIVDPPYFQVLLEHEWDNVWDSASEYLDWTVKWLRECKRLLRPDGLLYVFGQLGKREHVWLHLCAKAATEMQFHDMIIWDRAVGYNERYDSFTPQYEMILALRPEADSKAYFDKDAVRIPYDEATIQNYLRDKRYKDMEAREEHLRRGKYATNILRVPSLKGSSKEKVGHPSQKPVALIKKLVASGSRRGDLVLDPFLGSGTTAEACEELGRRWVGIELRADYVAMAERRVKSALTRCSLALRK